MKPLQLGPTQHTQAWESWHLAQSRPCEAEGPIVMRSVNRSVGLRRVRLLKLARTKASVAEQGEERCGCPRELNRCLYFTRTGSRRHMMRGSHFHARRLCAGPELSAGPQTGNRSGGHCRTAGHLVGRLMGSNWSGSWPSGTWPGRRGGEAGSSFTWHLRWPQPCDTPGAAGETGDTHRYRKKGEGAPRPGIATVY